MAADERWSTISKSSAETLRLGRFLGTMLHSGDVVGLEGDLGAGKTLFVRGVAEGMQTDRRYPVCSPTFTLINEHPGQVKLVHVDLYRLDDLDEMVEVGLFDYLGGEAACLVEWFDRLEGEEPYHRLALRLEVVGDAERCISAAAYGARHVELLTSWRRELGR